MMTLSHQKLVQMQHDHFNADDARKSQMQSYTQFIRDHFDREATPAEINAKWIELKNEPDTDFLID